MQPRFLAAAFAALAATISPAAHACSGGCDPWFLSPRTGATVPAGVGGLALWGSVNPHDLSNWRLTATSAGAGPNGSVPFVVESRAGWWWLVLSGGPFIEGVTYELAHDVTCPTGTTITRSFVAGAAAPLPTQLGTLTASTTSAKAKVPTTNGACVTEVDARIVKLSLTPAAEMSPYLSVVRLVTSIDGAPWAAQIEPTDAPHLGTARHDTIVVRCDASVAAGSGWLSAGTHTVTMTAEGLSAGAPSASVAFTVDCPAPTESPPATSTPASTAAPDESTGCAVAHSGPPSGRGAWLSTLLLVGCCWRRRRATPD